MHLFFSFSLFFLKDEPDATGPSLSVPTAQSKGRWVYQDSAIQTHCSKSKWFYLKFKWFTWIEQVLSMWSGIHDSLHKTQ